jgi:hypothetical protein
MKINKLFLVAFISAIFLASCSKDEIEQPPRYEPLGSYDSGVLVLNEGVFNAANASVSFISFDLNTVQNNIFGLVNPETVLGDTGQSITFNGNLAYIILNNSNKIQIVNRYTLKAIGAITSGLRNPRYMSIVNGKGYITNWGDSAISTDDYVAVLNLSNNSFLAPIPVLEGPERIIENAGKLYVSHKGGYGFGNKISVINANSNTVLNTIDVGDLPSTMQINNGNLWVLCEGKYSSLTDPLQETGGQLKKINLSTNLVTNTYSFATTSHPSNLELLSDNLYYTIGSDIYKMGLTPIAPATSISLPLNKLFTADFANLYGFGIKNNKIYVSGFSSFNSPGIVKVYSLGQTQDAPVTGTLLKNQTVGIGPNGFYFNQ